VMNSFAKAISLAMQYGAPVEEIVYSFAFVKFPPSGRIKGDKNIQYIESFIDYVVRSIGLRYRNMHHLADKNRDNDLDSGSQDGSNELPSSSKVAPERDTTSFAPKSSKDFKNSENSSTINKTFSGYTGEFCDQCNGCRMIRNGACSYCLDCNSTTGCG